MVRQDQPDFVGLRALADAAHVLGVVANLEIDEVDEPARADGSVEVDDLVVADRGPLATRFDRTTRENDGQRARQGAQSARGLDHRRSISNRLEIIDAPLDDVRFLRHDGFGFREDAFAGPSDQRCAEQRGFATQLLAARIDRLDRLFHAMHSNVAATMVAGRTRAPSHFLPLARSRPPWVRG